MMSPAVTNWMPGRHSSSALQVSLLGLVDLTAVLALQERITTELADRRDVYGELLLCEHPTGVTFGREGSATDLHVDRHDLISRGVAVEWLRRGGGTWAHHRGQLQAYLLVPYRRLGLSAVELRDRLALSLVLVAREFGLPAERSERPAGAKSRCGYFGFVGAAVRDGISQFGGCLNVSVPRPALGLVQWGDAVRPSSLAAERMRATSMSAVRECWLRHLAAQFGYDHYYLWTGHPWLHRSTRRGLVFVET